MASQPSPYRRGIAPAPQAANLADVLERVLDKGLVIVGDIRINLMDIELLTIKIRLLVASADKAAELGITWWQNDPYLTGRERVDGYEEIEGRVRQLESRLSELSPGHGGEAEATEPPRSGNSRSEPPNNHAESEAAPARSRSRARKGTGEQR